MSTDTVLEQKTVLKIETIKMWKVIIHNDDFTPFDFVIAVLVHVAKKSIEEADLIATSVHHQGKGIVGVYTKEIAETRCNQMNDMAKANKHPLLTTIEEA